MANPFLPYRVVLVDLEGTLYDDGGALPGAPEAVERLRAAGLAIRYVTNATRRPRAALAARLREMGFRVESGELFTAVSAAAAWCREAGHDRVLALLPEETLEDLAGLSIETPWRPALPADGRVGAVVVGDLGEGWSYEVLNAAFQRLMAGAALVACQKNRYWKTGDGLALDAGPFVAALEYAARAEAVVTGKPSEVLFRSALGGLGVQPREAVMVGDDAEIDVGGAIAAGLAGWLVKTGKYRPGDESRASPWPECVLGSVAELPEALGIE